MIAKNTARRSETCRKRVFLRHGREGISYPLGVPLRGAAPIRYFPSFYCQWDGETHLEQISVDSLMRMLEQEVAEGITELSCHPGYCDPSFESSYWAECEVELHTLCDPAIREALARLWITLASYHQYPAFAARERH
jgi:hypothetical protein